MWFGVITLFPEMLSAAQYGVTGRALQNKLAELHHWNPRDFTDNKHGNVDDRPYGGSPGMVMSVQPLQAAIHAAQQVAPEGTELIYLTPQGKRFDHAAATQFAKKKGLLFVAGRYEGIDERLMILEPGTEWSIGDYVLSGGEFAAMTMMDAITRLIPNVLGHAESAQLDSHSAGLLEYPHYTRPEIYQDLAVPEVLLHGNHQAIAKWRLKQSLGRTWQKRPDLLENITLSEVEQELLKEYISQANKE
ncbi:MAG: tRNA (guanosine(37)-N1)-methyltransferase TrmD [Gammaproteobacteria bacterium]|nr:tRNA (guanosine(37)-N1)-methyltransferase TrmD [Gammaproteobacteria bacterium]